MLQPWIVRSPLNENLSEAKGKAPEARNVKAQDEVLGPRDV
jgi:hypothetical protein